MFADICERSGLDPDCKCVLSDWDPGCIAQYDFFHYSLPNFQKKMYVFTEMLTVDRFKEILSHLFVFQDIIGEKSMVDYRDDIDMCMQRAKTNQDVNLGIFVVSKYTSKSRAGEGLIQSGVRVITNAVSAVTNTLSGDDEEAMNKEYAPQNIFRDRKNESDKRIILEIMMEASLIWQKELKGKPVAKPISSFNEAKNKESEYEGQLSSERIQIIIRNFYTKYSDKDNLSDWAKLYMDVIEEDYKKLISKIRLMLNNKLDDVQLPKVLMDMQKMIEIYDKYPLRQCGGAGRPRRSYRTKW